ncbi:MAG: DNA mismatch repair endonuclease MutL [bacterium]
MAHDRPKIRVLTDELANQIAAGEVVERPASVVKELVENAVDAGARRIHVAVERGGKALIRVVDDGCGMTGDEVSLALQRHATSKLRSLEDLTRIRSLGFRGEALPSIASVSRTTLISRVAGMVAGTLCEVVPGGAPRLSEAGCPVGTTVEVADLFWSVPARLKFLKTDKTESSHVAEAVLHLALAWPEIHFTLTEDGRPSLDLPRHPGLLERTTAALGRRARGGFHPAGLTRDGLVVDAALGNPGAAVGTARNVYLLVNRRGIRDRLMLRMLASGYGELLERGRYPVAVLHLRLPVDEVDVNVHPQKLEVRFVEEKDVARALHVAVAEGVGGAPWATVTAASAGRVYKLRSADATGAATHRPGARTEPVAPGRPADSSAREGAVRYPAGVTRGEVSTLSLDRDAPPGSLLRCRYLGQFRETYLLFEGNGELALLDQHAAHERVTYGRLRAGMAAGGVRMQRLLFPAQVALGPQEEEVVREHDDVLTACGFEVELLSGRSCAIRGVPALLADGDPEALLKDVAAELSHAPVSETLEQHWDHIAATLACHGSVRAGQALSPDEVRALLRALDEVERSGHCPHGRPVVVRLSETEIRRRFGRE